MASQGNEHNKDFLLVTQKITILKIKVNLQMLNQENQEFSLYLLLIL